MAQLTKNCKIKKLEILENVGPIVEETIVVCLKEWILYKMTFACKL